MLDVLSIGSLSGHGVLIMAFTAIVFVLFAWDRWPIQSVSLGVLIALPILFTFFPFYSPKNGAWLDPFDFFRGFGHEALIAIFALMILGHALVLTGALDPAARRLARLLEVSPRAALLVVLIACAAASGLMNDTPIVVIMIPILMSATAASKLSAASVLMPMNFAVLIGGMATTIGTSTNLIVVSMAASLGEPQIHMFDYYPIVALAAVPALVYLWLIAPWLLRTVKGVGANIPTAVFSAQLHVQPDSVLEGATLKDAFERTKWKMRVLEVRRGEDMTLVRMPTIRLQAGDRLLVEDTAANLKSYADILGAELHGVEDQRKDSDEDIAADAASATNRREGEPDRVLSEIIITTNSSLNGTSLRQSRFADTYGLIVVGLRRSTGSAEVRSDDIVDLRLSAEDVLLVQGTEAHLNEVKHANIGLVLDMRLPLPRADKAVIALTVLGLVVMVAAFKLAPIALAALTGVLALLATGCLKWQDISAALSIKVALLVASSLALGQAFTVTGGTTYLAEQMVLAAHSVEPSWFLALLMLLMGILTNFVSNNAAAAIGTPLAVALAQQLGVPAEALILAVLFGCNLCYVTPMGYQTNLLVMNAAGYRFSDFVKVGLPLFLLLWAILSMLLIQRYEI